VIPAGLGQVGVEFREFGTRVDFVAKVRGDTRISLEVRPTISEIDPTRSVTISGITVPGLRSRFVDTAVELNAGQTLAIAGLIQVRTEAEVTGVPGLSELPYIGVPFRRVREVQNEVELLILVTPELVEAMDPCEVPRALPGFNSQSPTDEEMFFRGYLETPDPSALQQCPPGQEGHAMPPNEMYILPPGNVPTTQINRSQNLQPQLSPASGGMTSLPMNPGQFAPVSNQVMPSVSPQSPTGFQVQPYAPSTVAPANPSSGAMLQDRTAYPRLPAQVPNPIR
jgi:pilus assembly protein CpaC